MKYRKVNQLNLINNNYKIKFQTLIIIKSKKIHKSKMIKNNKITKLNPNQK